MAAHDVLAAGGVAPRAFGAAGVVLEGVRVGPDLGGHELDDLPRDGLARPQGPPRVAQQAQLEGEAEAVGRAPADGHGRQVRLGEGVVAHQLPLLHLRQRR